MSVTYVCANICVCMYVYSHSLPHHLHTLSSSPFSPPLPFPPHMSDTGVLKLTPSTYKHARISYVMFDLRLESCDSLIGSHDRHVVPLSDHMINQGRVTWLYAQVVCDMPQGRVTY